MSDKLYIYTLFDHPADYPNEYVIRRFLIEAGKSTPEKELFFRSENLKACRVKMIEMGLYRMQADIQDDPVILETYI